jgi:hypothetical protein
MQFINVNDDKYVVFDKIKLDSLTEQETSEIKAKFGYDVVIKNNEAYYFCNKVQDAQIIEEFINRG